MRIFYDTEFVDDGKTIDLISIGLVTANGREYYAVNAEVNQAKARAHEFVSQHVWPQLPRVFDGELDMSHPDVKPRAEIARQVWEFATFGLEKGERAELWAYFGAYDHVALAQLYGPMSKMPQGLPWFTRELMQLWEYSGKPDKPRQNEGHHNALQDARWNRQLHDVCSKALMLRAFEQSKAASGETCTARCDHA